MGDSPLDFPSKEKENLYRKIYETMPDADIKREMLKDIMRLDPEQNYLSWKFPLLKYS